MLDGVNGVVGTGLGWSRGGCVTTLRAGKVNLPVGSFCSLGSGSPSSSDEKYTSSKASDDMAQEARAHTYSPCFGCRVRLLVGIGFISYVDNVRPRIIGGLAPARRRRVYNPSVTVGSVPTYNTAFFTMDSSDKTSPSLHGIAIDIEALGVVPIQVGVAAGVICTAAELEAGVARPLDRKMAAVCGQVLPFSTGLLDVLSAQDTIEFFNKTPETAAIFKGICTESERILGQYANTESGDGLFSARSDILTEVVSFINDYRENIPEGDKVLLLTDNPEFDIGMLNKFIERYTSFKPLAFDSTGRWVGSALDVDNFLKGAARLSPTMTWGIQTAVAAKYNVTLPVNANEHDAGSDARHILLTFSELYTAMALAGDVSAEW